MLRETSGKVACPQLGMKYSFSCLQRSGSRVTLCGVVCLWRGATYIQESETSHLMYTSSISEGLMTPGADPLALQTEPSTKNVLKRTWKRMIVVSHIQK
jgi:hypothetical protein